VALKKKSKGLKVKDSKVELQVSSHNGAAKFNNKSSSKTINKKRAAGKSKSQSAGSNDFSIKLNGEVWPLERDIFYRPSRMKYVRKLIKTEGCVFCTAAEKSPSFESLCVFKSKHSQIVLNKYPYNSGHLLVLPLRHCGEFLNLSSEEHQDLHATLKLAIEAVTEVYQPTGFNLGMNHGATGGAGIPDHLHYHIVPRWNGDLNFFPLIAETKLVIEDVEHSYEKFQKFFRGKK